MRGPLPWFAPLQTIQECVLQLEWSGVLHPLVGHYKNFSRLAKLDCRLVQLDGSVGAETDLEDYMGIPGTNVNGCSPCWSEPKSQLGVRL